MTGKADQWHDILQRHQDVRTEQEELRMKIQEAMTNYLQTVGETEDFTLIYNETAMVELNCKGDLFDLEQIGDFCDVFGLSLLINNRVVVEDYLQDNTEIITNYLFQYGEIKPDDCKDCDEGDCTCSN